MPPMYTEIGSGIAQAIGGAGRGVSPVMPPIYTDIGACAARIDGDASEGMPTAARLPSIGLPPRTPAPGIAFLGAAG